jgi:LacI family transcriptional regulator
MAVTIREVAKAAGVSTAAVSKVLHGRGNSVRVSDARAAHIRGIAESLNYRPNAVARNLRIRRTHAVGIIFENFGSFANGPLYYMHLFEGVGGVLFKNHYRMTILAEIAHGDVLSSLGDGQLDGVVWCKLTRDPESLALIHNCPIPIVAMNAPAPVDPTEAVFVSCDNEGGIDLAIQHLVALGHRRIAFLYERQELDTPDRQARLDGFHDSIKARTGVDAIPDDVLEWDWLLPEFAGWWAGQPPHTAIICWSERTAGNLILQATSAGLSLPRDLSIVGFDSTQYCETTTPRLTAVCQPIYEMAAAAATTLLAMIDGMPPVQSSFTFPCTFDVRDSTTTPRSPLSAENPS